MKKRALLGLGLLALGVALTSCGKKVEDTTTSATLVPTKTSTVDNTSTKEIHVHNYVSVNKVDPTCDKDGNQAYFTCSGCDLLFDVDKKEIDEIPVITKGHDYVKHEAIAKTCTTDGNLEYYTCNDCNAIFDSAKTIITAIPTVFAGHEYNKHEATSATCTVDGNVEYYTCSDCSVIFDSAKEVMTTSPIIPASHSYVKHEAVAKTCTEDGCLEYYTCNNCSVLFDSNKEEITAIPVVPSTGHTYPIAVDNLITNVVCEDCGYVNISSVATVGHYDLVVENPEANTTYYAKVVLDQDYYLTDMAHNSLYFIINGSPSDSPALLVLYNSNFEIIGSNDYSYILLDDSISKGTYYVTITLGDTFEQSNLLLGGFYDSVNCVFDENGVCKTCSTKSTVIELDSSTVNTISGLDYYSVWCKVTIDNENGHDVYLVCDNESTLYIDSMYCETSGINCYEDVFENANGVIERTLVYQDGIDILPIPSGTYYIYFELGEEIEYNILFKPILPFDTLDNINETVLYEDIDYYTDYVFEFTLDEDLICDFDGDYGRLFYITASMAYMTNPLRVYFNTHTNIILLDSNLNTLASGEFNTQYTGVLEAGTYYLIFNCPPYTTNPSLNDLCFRIVYGCYHDTTFEECSYCGEVPVTVVDYDFGTNQTLTSGNAGEYAIHFVIEEGNEGCALFSYDYNTLQYDVCFDSEFNVITPSVNDYYFVFQAADDDCTPYLNLEAGDYYIIVECDENVTYTFDLLLHKNHTYETTNTGSLSDYICSLCTDLNWDIVQDNVFLYASIDTLTPVDSESIHNNKVIDELYYSGSLELNEFCGFVVEAGSLDSDDNLIIDENVNIILYDGYYNVIATSNNGKIFLTEGEYDYPLFYVEIDFSNSTLENYAFKYYIALP